MTKIDEAIDRIKSLECATGHVEERVAGILEDFGVASMDDIVVQRDSGLDENGAKAFRARILNSPDESVVVLAKSGLDDYVAKVVDLYRG